MKNQSLALLAAPLLVLAACGDNQEVPDANRNRPPDARRADAMPPDAMTGSTVMVAAGLCPGTPDFDLTTVPTANGPRFREVGVPGNNPDIIINAGQTVQFVTAGNHNFASAAGTAMQFDFQSGPTQPHMACLTFTVATPAAITYQCDAHSATMNGSLDVN